MYRTDAVLSPIRPRSPRFPSGDGERIVRALERRLAARDPETGCHSERVAALTELLARELGLDPADREAARIGARVHDIGKVAVPARVLRKPGPLDDAERALVRRHPEVADRLLGTLGLPEAARAMARSHHERFAGGGYPDGLRGESIPLAARILAVADALDAMTADRPYRRALPADEAITEIERCAGEQFCPRVVGALRRCVQRHGSGAALLTACSAVPA